MRIEPQVEVTCLGKVLEGNGPIRSKMEEAEYEAFAEALNLCVAEIEEPDCSACIDGRLCICQADGSDPKLRPRKAGGGVAPLAMMGMGDRMFINDLNDNAVTLDDIFESAARLQKHLKNKESGHYDCGAAKGLVRHTASVSQFDRTSPTIRLVTGMVSKEHPDENAEELADDVIIQAAKFSSVLERRQWDGDKYVDKLAQKDASSVEKLEVDESDPVGGHAEDAIVLVDGPVDDDGRPIHTVDKNELFRLTGRQAFVCNLNEMRRDATQLGGSGKLVARLFTAGLMHLGGAYKNLGDGSHPVFIVQIA